MQHWFIVKPENSFVLPTFLCVSKKYLYIFFFNVYAFVGYIATVLFFLCISNGNHVEKRKPGGVFYLMFLMN